MLLQIGTADFEEVVKILFNKYNCFLYDCYEKPEYLKETLKELYGNTNTDMIKKIEMQIEEQSLPKPVKEFFIHLK